MHTLYFQDNSKVELTLTLFIFLTFTTMLVVQIRIERDAVASHDPQAGILARMIWFKNDAIANDNNDSHDTAWDAISIQGLMNLGYNVQV